MWRTYVEQLTMRRFSLNSKEKGHWRVTCEDDKRWEWHLHHKPYLHYIHSCNSTSSFIKYLLTCQIQSIHCIKTGPSSLTFELLRTWRDWNGWPNHNHSFWTNTYKQQYHTYHIIHSMDLLENHPLFDSKDHKGPELGWQSKKPHPQYINYTIYNNLLEWFCPIHFHNTLKHELTLV